MGLKASGKKSEVKARISAKLRRKKTKGGTAYRTTRTIPSGFTMLPRDQNTCQSCGSNLTNNNRAGNVGASRSFCQACMNSYGPGVCMARARRRF